MFGYFHNSSIRRYITLMGALFNHVSVSRVRDDVTSYTKVPITYASKERFIQKLMNITNTSDGDDTFAKIETILPRMNLSLIDINYNPIFKTNITNREINSRVRDGKPITTSQFNPVPFKLMFELGIYTRHEDDMFQIVEQILPYFQPNFSCKTTELHTNEITVDRDIQVTLQSISLDEDLEGDRMSRRRLEWSIIFELDGYLYPPVKDIHNEIKTVYVDFFANTHKLEPEGIFESVDSSPCPGPDVERDEWNGEYKQGYSGNVPIPSGIIPPGVRGIVSGCPSPMPIEK
ncbi:MAG: tail sheath stabilizer and completion protein [Bacilli bacterium]